MAPQAVIRVDPAAWRLVEVPGAELFRWLAEPERAAAVHRLEVTGGHSGRDVGRRLRRLRMARRAGAATWLET
jgi:hypothetical protein